MWVMQDKGLFSLACQCAVFSGFIEETIFSPLASLSNIRWLYIYKFISEFSVSVSMPDYYFLWLQICNTVWNQEMCHLHLMFFLEIALAIWDLLLFIWNIGFSISVENSVEILTDIALTL